MFSRSMLWISALSQFVAYRFGLSHKDQFQTDGMISI